MQTLILEDDTGCIQSFIVKDYNIQIDEDHRLLLFELNVGNYIFGYRVHEDIREPKIQDIALFIESAAKATFKIIEYLDRDYIYVESGDMRKQFTAQKF